MGLLAGIDPHDFARRERVKAALQEDGEFKDKARIADPHHPCADLQLLIEQDWRLVFDDRFDDVEIDAGLPGVGILVITQRPEILGNGRIEIGQVVRVEDNALTVDFGSTRNG
jgi:hypothetical protein